MRSFRYLVLLLGASLAGCSWQGPSLASYPGLQYQVISYYDGRAMEANASCPNPYMRSITSARVVEQTPERVVMDIRCHWVDDQVSADVQGGIVPCQDWGERTFTFASQGDGRL